MNVKKINLYFVYMKKILTFALAALTALSFPGCMKSGSSWEDMQPVMPGMYIYQMALNQNVIAMEPASAGMRLAMLVSEALAQDPDYDLTKLADVKASDKPVLTTLFNSQTEIEVIGTNDNVESYRIKFKEGMQQADGLVLSGSMLVRTNGAKSLAEGGTWDIILEDVTATSTSSSGGSQQTTKIYINGGMTRITNAGDVYAITISGLSSNFDESSITSSWSGNFKVTVPDATYTYETCAGKLFKLEGIASGQSMYAASELVPLSLSYSVSEATYAGLQIVDGKQTCKLTNPLEYDPTAFPSSEVVYYWTLNELNNTVSCQISYNGSVYQLY